jgi:hypothetical protein
VSPNCTKLYLSKCAFLGVPCFWFALVLAQFLCLMYGLLSASTSDLGVGGVV